MLSHTHDLAALDPIASTGQGGSPHQGNNTKDGRRTEPGVEGDSEPEDDDWEPEVEWDSEPEVELVMGISGLGLSDKPGTASDTDSESDVDPLSGPSYIYLHTSGSNGTTV